MLCHDCKREYSNGYATCPYCHPRADVETLPTGGVARRDNRQTMKLFACTSFGGHWPVGTAAIIVAPTVERALVLMEAEIDRRGLRSENPNPLTAADLLDVPLDVEGAMVLHDGNY